MQAGNAYIAGYTLSFDLPTTSNAFQRSIGGGVCDYWGGPCGDAFLAKISAGGSGVTPAISLSVSPTDVAPGGIVRATWAGNPTPTARDYLRIFALGSAGDEFEDPFFYWPTPNSASGALQLLLPAGLPPGWYELRLLSPDARGVMSVIARSAPINTGPHADVVVTAVTNPPAIAGVGNSFTVTDTTANRGNLASAGSMTRFYLSLDRVRNTADRLLTGSRSVGALAPSATSTGATTVTIPTATPLGTYVLLACADDTSTNIELNESNNCTASAGSVVVAAPDLVATTVSNPPATARVGTSFNVTDSAANRGRVASAASVTRYYLSLDRAKSTGDALLGGSRNVPILAVNAVSTGAATVTIPTATAAGTYYLLACADDTKVRVESNETNNCVASASAIKVGP